MLFKKTATTPEERQYSHIKKDNVINFMLTATPEDIETKVNEKLDGTDAPTLRTQMRELFTLVFIILSVLVRNILKKRN